MRNRVKEVKEELFLDDNTKQSLQNCVLGKKKLDADMQLILNTWLNAKGLKGGYSLSTDCSKLIKSED